MPKTKSRRTPAKSRGRESYGSGRDRGRDTDRDRGRDRGGRGRGGKSEFVRLTALFAGRNGGRVGSVRDEYLDNLQELVEKAQDAGKGVAFFLKRWSRDEDPVLSATIAQDYKGGGRRRGRARDNDDYDDGGDDTGHDDSSGDYDL